jgi:hypothetical protein
MQELATSWQTLCLFGTQERMIDEKKGRAGAEEGETMHSLDEGI